MSKNLKNSDDICPKCGKEPCVCETEDPESEELTEDGCKKTKIDEECDKCGQKDGCKKRKGMMDGCGKSKKMDSARVDRIDFYGPINDKQREEWGYTQKFTKTDEGFLKGRAVLTNIGVFQYLQPNGTIRREARLPEEVFSQDSLASLSMKPVTLGHPKEKVSPENADKLKVGSVGSRIDSDGYYVFGDVIVTDAAAIQAVESGEARGMSLGYSCDMEETPGNFLGVPFDAIQRNIRYNHDAIVKVPRAGDAAFIRMDSGDEVPVGNLIPSPITPEAPATKTDGTTPQLRTGGETMKKIRLDGAVEHDVPEAVALHIDSLDAKVKALDSEKSTLQGKLDSATEALEAEKKARADEAAGFSAKVDAAVQSRIAMVALATKNEVKADGTDDEIRKAITLKAFPNAKLDGQDPLYLKARFDCAVEALEAAAKLKEDGSSNSQRQSISDVPAPTGDRSDASDWSDAWKTNGAK